MSGGKGGGSPDTSGMERATEQSNALQERMYDEGVARQQPFYDIGLGGANMLADYMGIDRTPQQRDSIYQSLLPQFTTQTATGTGGGGAQYFKDGKFYNEADLLHPSAGGTNPNGWGTHLTDGGKTMQEAFQGLGYESTGGFGGGTTDSIDYAGLNSAVDAQMGDAQRPDYFGSLLDPFSAEKFETDPSYLFRQEEGNKALERSQAALHGTLNPRAQKEMLRYNQGLASTEYGNAYNRYNNDQTQIYNRLSGLLGVGQQTANQVNASGTNFANQTSQNNFGLANAQASAQQAAQTGKQSMFNTLLGVGGALGGAWLGR